MGRDVSDTCPFSCDTVSSMMQRGRPGAYVLALIHGVVDHRGQVRTRRPSIGM